MTLFLVGLEGQDRAFGQPEDPLGHRADEVLLHPSSAVGGHDDEVGVDALGIVRDGLSGFSGFNQDLNPWILVGQPCLQGLLADLRAFILAGLSQVPFGQVGIDFPDDVNHMNAAVVLKKRTFLMWVALRRQAVRCDDQSKLEVLLQSELARPNNSLAQHNTQRLRNAHSRSQPLAVDPTSDHCGHTLFLHRLNHPGMVVLRAIDLCADLIDIQLAAWPQFCKPAYSTKIRPWR